MIDSRFSIIKKLDVPTQLNLARKLAPALPIVDGLIREENKNKDRKILIIIILSQLSDANSEYVTKTCLSCIGVNQNGLVSKLQTDSGLLMFDDVTLNDICELVAQVIDENIGDFLLTSLSALKV